MRSVKKGVGFMKVLSFSGSDEVYLKYILPALLNTFITKDKTKPVKTTTIRPAWKTVRFSEFNDDLSKKKGGRHLDVERIKEPRFNVGEPVRLEWKSRNSPKGSYFCCNCGRKTTGKNDEWDNEMCPVHGSCDAFEKILGYGKITEVFKIEMRKDQTQSDGYGVKRLDRTLECFKDLWERDGFTDAETMFSWFDSHYDLKTPKTFWVYRWRKA